MPAAERVLLPFDFPFRGAGRDKRDARTEAVAGSHWRTGLQRQSQFGYAGDDENPRELPRRTLSSMRELMQDVLDGRHDDGTLVPPHGLHIAFCDEALEVSAPEVIPVPREHLWWLAAPGDLLLLTDRITTHFTTMLHAVTPSGPMQLVDEWPDRVFLREGYNEADVAARSAPFFGGVFESVVPGRRVVEIDRDEYLRVAVGLVTYDTPRLFEALFDHDPARYRGAAAQLALGRALMAPSHDEIAHLAAPYFRRAEAQALHEGCDELARAAAAGSYVAHAIAMLGQRDGAAVQAGQPFADELLALQRRHGEAALLAALDVEVLIRLGHAAGRAQRYDQAFAWLGLAIERNPFHDAAHWMRAKPVEQVADATEALRRNQAWIDRRIAEHNARDPRDHAGHHDDLGRIAGLMTRRAEELTIRAGGLVQLGRLDEAEADLREAARLKPEDSRVAQLLAALPSLRDAFAAHVAAQGREGSR